MHYNFCCTISKILIKYFKRKLISKFIFHYSYPNASAATNPSLTNVPRFVSYLTKSCSHYYFLHYRLFLIFELNSSCHLQDTCRLPTIPSRLSPLQPPPRQPLSVLLYLVVDRALTASVPCCAETPRVSVKAFPALPDSSSTLWENAFRFVLSLFTLYFVVSSLFRITSINYRNHLCSISVYELNTTCPVQVTDEPKPTNPTTALQASSQRTTRPPLYRPHVQPCREGYRPTPCFAYPCRCEQIPCPIGHAIERNMLGQCIKVCAVIFPVFFLFNDIAIMFRRDLKRDLKKPVDCKFDSPASRLPVRLYTQE